MTKKPLIGILGASGFIGSRLVEWLLLRDLARVRPIVRSYRGMARAARFDLDLRIADATDAPALASQLSGCDVLVHCVVGERDTILNSLKASYQAAAAAGVGRLVYISSAVVHGHSPATGTHDDSPLVEKQAFGYNVSKVLAERLLAALREDGRVETVVIKPCIVFGPRSTWWTAEIAASLLQHRAYLVDGGIGVCNTVYIDNLAHAIYLAAIHRNAANQAFFITDDTKVAWRDLYASVAREIGADMREVTNVAGADARATLSASAKYRFLRSLRHMRLAQAVKKRMPKAMGAKVGGLIETSARRAGDNLSPLARQIDPELVSLQQCSYTLPIRKALDLLGYAPIVGFEEAAQRTGAWLRFALGLKEEAGPCP